MNGGVVHRDQLLRMRHVAFRTFQLADQGSEGNPMRSFFG